MCLRRTHPVITCCCGKTLSPQSKIGVSEIDVACRESGIAYRPGCYLWYRQSIEYRTQNHDTHKKIDRTRFRPRFPTLQYTVHQCSKQSVILFTEPSVTTIPGNREANMVLLTYVPITRKNTGVEPGKRREGKGRSRGIFCRDQI